MTDLEALKAELARQDREFESIFEQLRAIDPDLVLAVSNEMLSAFEDKSEAPVVTPPNWAQRI